MQRQAYETRQRETLCGFFRENPDVCFTPRELADRLGAAMSLSAVYRNLASLAAGFVSVSAAPGETTRRYRLAGHGPCAHTCILPVCAAAASRTCRRSRRGRSPGCCTPRACRWISRRRACRGPAPHAGGRRHAPLCETALPSERLEMRACLDNFQLVGSALGGDVRLPRLPAVAAVSRPPVYRAPATTLRFLSVRFNE